ERKAHQANGSQQMLRPLTKSGQEFDREQIEKSLHKPANAVFRVTEAARAVIDLDLTHRVAPSGRQDGDETVQLAVETHLAKNGRAIAFHAAIMIVKPNPGEPADQEIENAARKDFVPRIVPDSFPAADDIQAFLHG